MNPKNGNVAKVRRGSPLDEGFGIDFDAQGRMFLPESPDANGDFDVWRMTRSGAGLKDFSSPDFGRPYGVAVGG